MDLVFLILPVAISSILYSLFQQQKHYSLTLIFPRIHLLLLFIIIRNLHF